jgi:hypothetical protein
MFFVYPALPVFSQEKHKAPGARHKKKKQHCCCFLQTVDKLEEIRVCLQSFCFLQ